MLALMLALLLVIGLMLVPVLATYLLTPGGFRYHWQQSFLMCQGPSLEEAGQSK
jgi:hypothetical protein